MHIPENYLSPETCTVMIGAMLPVWYKSIHKVEKIVALDKEVIPKLGLGTSLAFLIMMFNLPVPGGTTAHAVGAVLLAILLGPWGACLSVSTALFLQAILFGDGGILAFGANCFSMAFIMPFSGYYIYRFLKEKTALAPFISGYIGINCAAFCTSLLLGLQPLLFHTAQGLPLYNPYGLSVTLPAMMGTHLLIIGVVEGIFTFGVLRFLNQSGFTVAEMPLSSEKATDISKLKKFIFTLIILCPLGLIASGTAWGEWGIGELGAQLKKSGLIDKIPLGMKNGFSFHALFSDYSIPGLPSIIGYILSALSATIIFILIFRIIFGRRNHHDRT